MVICENDGFACRAWLIFALDSVKSSPILVNNAFLEAVGV
jgi:hypothetical protein